MEITNIPTEELLKELNRRSEEERLTAYTEKHFLCIGILDDLGAESIIPVKTPEEFNKHWFGLMLRARYGTNTNREVYSLRIPQAVFDNLNRMFKAEEFLNVAQTIRSLSTYKKIY